MSMTTTGSGASASRSPVAPANVSRASSSPEIVRASKPKSSRTRSRNAAPFSASRTALVRTATVCSAPASSIASRYSDSTATTRSTASSASRPVASTSWPSRVTVERRSSSVSSPPPSPSSSTSATSSRVEFVPMSTTATRTARSLAPQPSSGSPVMPVASPAVGPSPGAKGAASGPPGVPSPAPPATPAPPSSPVPVSSTAPSSGGRSSRCSVCHGRAGTRGVAARIDRPSVLPRLARRC